MQNYFMKPVNFSKARYTINQFKSVLIFNLSSFTEPKKPMTVVKNGKPLPPPKGKKPPPKGKKPPPKKEAAKKLLKDLSDMLDEDEDEDDSKF